MDLNVLISKVDELRAARDAVARIERELGEAVGAREPGKMLVSAPTVAAVLDAPSARHVAQKDFPAEGIESLPHRLVRLLEENPGKTFSPRSAAEALGEEFRKTHASLLHRAARKGTIAKKGPGTFAALAPRKNGRKK